MKLVNFVSEISFNLNGRVNLKTFRLTMLIVLLLLSINYLIMDVYQIYLFNSNYGLIIILGAFWFITALKVKRLHDLGYSGFFGLVPIFNLYLTYLMYFKKGSSRKNKYDLIAFNIEERNEFERKLESKNLLVNPYLVKACLQILSEEMKTISKIEKIVKQYLNFGLIYWEAEGVIRVKDKKLDVELLIDPMSHFKMEIYYKKANSSQIITVANNLKRIEENNLEILHVDSINFLGKEHEENLDVALKELGVKVEYNRTHERNQS